MSDDLAAVCWDLDGTLIDSEPLWMATEQELAAEAGAQWTAEDALESVGHPIVATAARLAGRGVAGTAPVIARRMVERMAQRVADGVPYRPGAVELVHSLAEQGIAQALVTMSVGAYVEACAAALPPGAFAVVRTGDSVGRPKPAPDIYRAAFADLGLPARSCLAIEDSPAGVGAILAAGCTPVAVPFQVPLDDEADLVVLGSLAGVTPDRLRSIHARWQSRR